MRPAQRRKVPISAATRKQKIRQCMAKRKNADDSQLPRKLMLMVASLHERGYECLYYQAGLEHLGWYEYEIGAMVNRQWPSKRYSGLNVGGLIGDPDGFSWANLHDSVETLAEKFLNKHKKIADEARRPFPEYRAWFSEMLERTKPDGWLMFTWGEYDDHAYEFASALDGPEGFSMPMPPGHP